MENLNSIEIINFNNTKINDLKTCDENDKPQVFRKYQFILFLLTQSGYFAIAGSMLSTTTFEPSKDSCNLLVLYKNSSDLNSMEFDKNYQIYRQKLFSEQFFSLVMEWREECDAKSKHFFFSLSFLTPLLLMVGAIFGSFFAGFLADRFGRKPVVIGSLLCVCISNFIIATLGKNYFDNSLSSTYVNSSSFDFPILNKILHLLSRIDFQHYIIFCSFFFMGASCGGYMVTNIIFLVEAIYDSSNLRLLSVALNGWPFGMVFTAVISSLTLHWRYYHLIIAAVAILVATFLELFAFESYNWHRDRGDYFSAVEMQKTMSQKYSKASENYPKIYNKYELNVLLRKDSTFSKKNILNKNTTVLQYSYFDLFRHKKILINLAQLSFCFFSSSVVSYGLFFLVDILPGNRYTNMAIMGSGKFILGLVTFIFSFFVGRKSIMVVSLTLACLLCWLLIIVFSICCKNLPAQESIILRNNISLVNDISLTKALINKSWHYGLIAWLALALSAILDPTWKVNHLYSMELFPTQIRNMCRGFCNVAARFGSLSGPLVIVLRKFDVLYPFWLFGVLLTFQWIISFTLPETKFKNLPQTMPLKKNKSLKTLNSIEM